MTMNWRGKAARAQFYFNEGSNSLQQLKQALYAAAAIKVILELSVLTAIILTPVVIVSMFAWGVIWIRYGWYRHLAEMPSIEAVSPIQVWGLYMSVRLSQRFGIRIDDMDLATMPQELQSILTSRSRHA